MGQELCTAVAIAIAPEHIQKVPTTHLILPPCCVYIISDTGKSSDSLTVEYRLPTSLVNRRDTCDTWQSFHALVQSCATTTTIPVPI